MTELRREGDVFIFHMDAEENRFDPDMIDAWNGTFDEVEKTEGPKALVTTGSGKFYSNGLDLEYGRGSGDFGGYIKKVLGLYARVLTLPCNTVAAMNGHAFGAGGQIALAHDFRLMRAERGYFCMPEIDMGMPLHPGMTAILKSRLPKQTCHEVITTGRRYGGEDAAEACIVDRALPEAEVLPAAIELAASLASKAHPAMTSLKEGLYPEILEALARPLS